MNNMDYQYDTTCRLSAEDKQMMTGCNRFSDSPNVRKSKGTHILFGPDNADDRNIEC